MAGELAEIMTSETYKLVGIMHAASDRGGHAATHPGQTVPEPEAYDLLMDIVASHLEEWFHEGLTDLEIALARRDYQNMQQALATVRRTRYHAEAALLHGMVPRIRHSKRNISEEDADEARRKLAPLSSQRREALKRGFTEYRVRRPGISFRLALEEYAYFLRLLPGDVEILRETDEQE